MSTAREIKIHELTLLPSTSPAHTAGDVLVDTLRIEGAVPVGGDVAILRSVVIIDKDDQGAAMDLVFLDSNVSIGTPNAVVSITDANAAKIVGVLEIANTGYIDLIGSQALTLPLSGELAMPLKTLGGATSDRNLYVAAITRGTPTHTAAGLVLKLGLQTS